MNKALTAALCCAFLANVILVLPLAGVAQTKTCSEIIHERNDFFDGHKSYVRQIKSLRIDVAAEKAQIDLLSGTAQEAAKQRLADAEARLKTLENDERVSAARLKELDGDVERCRKGGQESRGGSWVGTWISSDDRDYQISSWSGGLSYTLKSVNGKTTGVGSCEPSGNAAKCTYQERFGGAPGPEMDLLGTQLLTLAGDTITEQRTLTGAVCYRGADAWCEAAKKHQNQAVQYTWHRKK